jgi:hypothetical protein
VAVEIDQGFAQYLDITAGEVGSLTPRGWNLAEFSAPSRAFASGVVATTRTLRVTTTGLSLGLGGASRFLIAVEANPAARAGFTSAGICRQLYGEVPEVVRYQPGWANASDRVARSPPPRCWSGPRFVARGRLRRARGDPSHQSHPRQSQRPLRGPDRLRLRLEGFRPSGRVGYRGVPVVRDPPQSPDQRRLRRRLSGVGDRRIGHQRPWATGAGRDRNGRCGAHG